MRVVHRRTRQLLRRRSDRTHRRPHRRKKRSSAWCSLSAHTRAVNRSPLSTAPERKRVSPSAGLCGRESLRSLPLRPRRPAADYAAWARRLVQKAHQDWE